MYGVTIGGTYGANADNISGAKIDYVVIFDDATGDVVTDINNFSVSGMTTVGTDLGTATAETGVNLPASATLTAAATPAAVFVQQTSTLTMTGSASLTVNSGTGPLYVADGTTLTIDATGITSLTAQNPSVTLVSAKIYGTDLITVKAPVIAGAKVVASVTENGITLTYSGDTVSITSPFDGSTLSEPTSATGYGASSTSVSFGNTEAFQKTIGGRAAIVADVFGGTFTDINGFMKQGETTSNTNKDVYLVVSGATARRINGVQEAHWQGNTRRTRTEGNAIVQIEDGATVDYVYGAGYKGGRMPTTVDGNNDKGASAQVQGNTGVTVKGGTVNGSIIGGWSSAHNGTPTVTGNTAVRIEKVLGTATATAEDGNVIVGGYIVGGSVYQAHTDSASLVGGNSSVTLALTGKSGTFDRTVIGGSAQFAGETSGNHNVTGNSSVTITAANDVTFPNQIVGGGAKLVSSGSGVVNVGGNSSVTISGGTYTGRIVAGGYAPNGGTANVAGTATLTLNSGVFTGATLDGGNATGVKTLAVGDNLDISDATATGFTAVTLGDGATARMTVGEEGSVTLGDGATLILDVTDEAVADGHTATVVSKGTGASIKYYENGEEITDSSRLDGDNLNASAPVWSPAEADASGNFADVSRWSTGVLPADNTSVVKLVVNGNNTLTINETRTFGHLYVEGSGTLSIQGDNTHYLYANDVTIASGVTIKIVGFSGAFQPKNGTISGGTAIVIPYMGFLQLDGIDCSTKIELQSGGYLWTKGTTTLSSTANTFASGAGLVTKAGTNESPSTTTVYSAGKSFNSTVTVEESSTLIAEHTGDMVDWGASTRINVYGKLTVNCRWSMNPNNEIYFYPGAVIDGTGGGTAIFDMLSGNSVIHVAAHPDSGATGTVTCSAPIRLRANATVDVAEGMTFLMTGNTIKQNDNCGYTKTGAGLLHIKGSFTPGGTTTVSAGKILFEDTNIGSESLPGNLAGSGTVEFKSTSTHNYFYASASAFTGKIIVTKTGSTWPHIIGSAPQTSSSTPPELELSGGVVLTHTFNNNSFYVKDLSGSGTFDTGYGELYNNDHTSRTLDVLLTKNSAFSGIFAYSDTKTSTKHRNACLTVRGSDNADSVYALKLSGVSTSYGQLMVQNNAKVVFTSDGSWLNGSTTVKSGGVLESQRDAQVVGALTLEAGSTLAYGDDSQTIKTSGALTLPASGKVTVDVGDLTIAGDASKELLTVGSGEMGINQFTQVGNTATHMLLVSGQTLSLIPVAATLTQAGTVTPYETVDLAVAMLEQVLAASSTSDAFVTLVNGTASDLTTTEQLAEYGIIYDEASGTYGRAVAQIGSSSYPSLAAAFEAAEASGDTVTLLQDITAVNIPLNDKSITFAENGKSFTGTLTGNGTIIVSAAPSTTAWAAAMFADGWTGEFVCEWAHSSDSFEAKNYGNANSTVTLRSMTGGQFSKDVTNGTANYDGTIKIAGTVQVYNGWGDNTDPFSWGNTTTFNKLILADGGSLKLTWGTSAVGVGYKVNTLYPRGGTITLANAKSHIRIGSVNLTAEPELNTRIVQITPQKGHVYNGVPIENGPIDVTVTANEVTSASSTKLFFDTDGLYVAAAYAVISGATKYFKSAAAAAEAADADATITILASTEAVSVAPGQKVVVADGVTVGSISWGDEYAAETNVTGDGTTEYTHVAAAAVTYYWTGATDSAWSTPGNWAVDAENGPTATREVTSIDSVVFNDGATVTLDANTTVAGIKVKGAVSISGSAKSLNTSGNITGTGTLTLNDICLASAGAELTVEPNINFTNDSELARVTSGKFIINGNITARGTFKVWDVTHTVNGNLSIASGVNMAIGSGLEVNGTTTFNGDFSKSQNGTLTIGNVVVAENTSITAGSGSIAITGTVSPNSGKRLAIPASNVTYSSATFAGSGTVSFATIPSSALTFGENWTGTVALPEFNSSEAFNFNNYGKVNSTVEIAGFSRGWLKPPAEGTVAINPNLKLTGAFNPAAYSAREYTFQAISGNGDFSVSSTDLTSMSIAKIASDYTGTITNISSGKPITITVVDLAAVPAVGDRLLKVSGDNITISRVTVNGTPTPLKWKRKTVGDVDGFYVVSGTIFSVY